MPEVGFIGLGTMGGRMVAHVARRASRTVVYDADAVRTAAVAAQVGATPATSAADLAGLDVVVTMLPTSAVVRNALLDWDGGVPVHLAPGAVVVDMSSSRPSETVDLGAVLTRSGVALVDAPVSGGVARAQAGTLAVMMGGDDAAADRASEVVGWMSDRIFRTGPLGSGHAAKALNNFVAGAATTACFEALTAAERFGIDPATLVDVLDASTGQSFVTSHVLPDDVVGGARASGFALGLYAKDVDIARRLMDELDVDAAVCRAVSGRLDEALEALGDVDHTRAYDHVRGLRSATVG
jgi:3-hydroxyisobutyrate dehydrogenase